MLYFLLSAFLSSIFVFFGWFVRIQLLCFLLHVFWIFGAFPPSHMYAYVIQSLLPVNPTWAVKLIAGTVLGWRNIYIPSFKTHSHFLLYVFFSKLNIYDLVFTTSVFSLLCKLHDIIVLGWRSWSLKATYGLFVVLMRP